MMNLLESCGGPVFFAIVSGLVHSIVFWGLNAIFYGMHVTGVGERFKFVRKNEAKPELIKACLRDLMVSHAVLQWFSFYGLYYIFSYRGGATINDPIPSCFQIIYETIISFVVNDFLFYWAHRAFHHPFLYAKFHKQHHKFNATIGIAAEYAHPVEYLFANALPTVVGPILQGSHPISFWIYLGLRVWETVESHSGYDFPFSLWSLFDWQGGAEAHDYHHSANVGNYGGVCFSFWDSLMGTDKAYRKHLAKKE